MSLCFATITMNGLLIASDSAVVDINNKFVKNQDKIFKMSDNVMIFTSGELKTNLEVIAELKRVNKDKFSNISEMNKVISDICKKVYKHYRHTKNVRLWELEEVQQLNEWERQQAIPICLTVFYYEKNKNQYYSIKFRPIDFPAEINRIKFGQILIDGYKADEASQLLRKNKNNIRSVNTEIKRFENVYRELEQQFPEIGGTTKYFMMGHNSCSIIYMGGK